MGMGSLEVRLSREFLSGEVGVTASHEVAKPKSVRTSEVQTEENPNKSMMYKEVKRGVPGYC